MPTRDHSSTDALAVLRKDHQAVEQLFRRFERARTASERKRIAARVVRELSVHTAVEEELFYPALRRRANGADGRVLVALEEHHVAKLELAEIERLGGSAERFAAKVGVLADHVRHHILEEERELFPLARRTLSAEELALLGAALVRAREAAPTRPHPSAPDEPPGNLTNVGVAAFDRGRDVLGRGLARVIDRSRVVVEQALRRGEVVAREARARLGRGLERAGREVRPDSR
jgi:hemerythrin-like domain-containing protein